MSKRLLLLALVAGCATPTAPTVTLPKGLGKTPERVTVGTVTAPSPVKTPRATPSKASRSRALAAPSHGTGPRLDVTCYSWTGSRTASGKWPRVGMAASNSYPFGTRLLVEHVGIVTVEDRIGHGTDLDLYGPSESYCRRFGRQHLRVQVIR